MNGKFIVLAISLFAVSFFVSMVYIDIENAEGKRRLACGRDFCVDTPGDCIKWTCRFLGNGRGSGCDASSLSGSSCGSDGICIGATCFSDAPPTVSVSGPSSVSIFDAGTFTATSTPPSWKSTTSMQFYVDSVQEGTCSPTSSGGGVTCEFHCLEYCGSGKRHRCCNSFYSTCSATGSSASSCTFDFDPSEEKTYSYYATALDNRGKTGTSTTKTFEGVGSCNSNGVCEVGETSTSCAADCSATCTNNGVCEADEILACADCNTCNKNGVCDAGETSAVCPSDCADFNITADPVKGIANKGDAKTINVTATLVTGTTASITFSVLNIPSDLTAAFTPTSCTAATSCYSNLTLTTSAGSPEGSREIIINGTFGSTSRGDTYNLTVLPTSATCGNAVCEFPETQSSCSNDCATTASIPSPVSPGQSVTVEVEFYDFRYVENGKVQIDMTINPEGTAWTPVNGCFFGGKKMGATAGNGAIAWPGNTVSEDGHFKISTTCTLPSSIAAGAHTLVATPTIF